MGEASSPLTARACLERDIVAYVLRAFMFKLCLKNGNGIYCLKIPFIDLFIDLV